MTQWSGVISALGVTATILLFAPLAQYIPRAALSGVLILTASRMVDPKSIMYAARATRFDAMIMVATAVSAVFISIEFCILIGVVLSFALYVPRAAKIHVSELTLTNTRIIREATKKRCPLFVCPDLEHRRRDVLRLRSRFRKADSGV